jgi:two-component system alkaline phosphatase synthesis response regulator PhoP
MSEPGTILIIDDDPDFVTAITHLLEKSGYQVRTAPSGRQGYDLACAITPDLILLDVIMSERTEGFFTLERIRNTPALEHTPVIVVSSIYTECPSFRVDPGAGWLPANLFLAKPVDPARLLEEAARLMSASPSPSESVAS